MNKKILIIEDARDIAEVFKKQLDLLERYDTDIASGGQQGLEMIANNQYDLVLLDLIMPEVDGIEVLNTMKADQEKYHQTSVMALTNVTSEDTRKGVEELGVVKYIVKTDTDIDQVVDEFFNQQ